MIAPAVQCVGMSTGNLYHLLRFIPATEGWEMSPGLERAARALVASGRLRINADTQRNFVRHGTADSDQTFTARELTDPALLARTRAALARHVAPAHGAQGVEDLLARLRQELVKARGVSVEKELKVARVITQSAHPAVIQLLLESGAEVFVSYSHNVGDLMAVHDWQGHGTSSGLQATSQDGAQVFISCNGDPFFEGEQKTYTTDGFPALARMVVIGGQELGHFSDLIRSNRGILGRYSLSDTVHAGRRADIAHMARWKAFATRAGLSTLLRAEKSVAFYAARKLMFSPPWLYWQLRRGLAWARCALALRGSSIPFHLPLYPRHRAGEALALFLDDMAFNLAPQADVYRHPDPAQEEAIACIEALARVPQQVMKWGQKAVLAAWPRLTPFYYSTVIGGCEAVLTHPAPATKMTIYQQLMAFMRRRLRARPGYHPSRRH